MRHNATCCCPAGQIVVFTHIVCPLAFWNCMIPSHEAHGVAGFMSVSAVPFWHTGQTPVDCAPVYVPEPETEYRTFANDRYRYQELQVNTNLGDTECRCRCSTRRSFHLCKLLAANTKFDQNGLLPKIYHWVFTSAVDGPNPSAGHSACEECRRAAITSLTLHWTSRSARCC